jgi:hypothetical protein
MIFYDYWFIEDKEQRERRGKEKTREPADPVLPLIIEVETTLFPTESQKRRADILLASRSFLVYSFFSLF